MSTTAAEQPVLEVLNQNADKPKKKFQVVPVPGEFTRGRWKVIDTRFGSAMGIFGNYPPEDEYKMISVVRNNVITVRKKFRRHPPLPEDATTKEADSIRVLQKSQPRLDQVPVTNQIKILIMDPETAAVTAQKLAANAVGVTEVVGTFFKDGIVKMRSSLNLEKTMVAPTSDITSSMSSVTLLDTDPAKMDETAKLANATSNTVVAIDNKIVQAMDLVKTHLTFAVREEVECLRSTITDLEERLNALREENRLLRENVSPDVLAFITANKQIVE
ncbi:Protein CBG00127 [Caenorhabditis briggsae]|uniref:Protein CBG00127 n=1 Tax=Caenorhabditis briggsae TaxID=6238 RepID=A8WMC4_CAEBR|nr:Protein CBG00127 [Caenorhabditis briggsae]CAP21628.2 Protein CBG00127 [Caenorhabditis briggsae]